MYVTQHQGGGLSPRASLDAHLFVLPEMGCFYVITTHTASKTRFSPYVKFRFVFVNSISPEHFLSFVGLLRTSEKTTGPWWSRNSSEKNSNESCLYSFPCGYKVSKPQIWQALLRIYLH